MIRARLAAAVLLVAGCGTPGGPIPAPEAGTVAVAAETALTFQARAESFYMRLLRRRFNALETFNDKFLRKHFRTENAFFDYYAELANAMNLAHFEKSRPSEALVMDFLFETPTAVLVQVRYRGEDNRPLRPNSVLLVRYDRWDWVDENWWVTPVPAWR